MSKQTDKRRKTKKEKGRRKTSSENIAKIKSPLVMRLPGRLVSFDVGRRERGRGRDRKGGTEGENYEIEEKRKEDREEKPSTRCRERSRSRICSRSSLVTAGQFGTTGDEERGREERVSV